MNTSSLPGWPARLQCEMAAAYVGLFKPDGTPDTQAFRAQVAHGLYPKPYKRAGERQAWLRSELDEVLEGLRRQPVTETGELD